ncbi:MAG TPA: hypothetical protein VLH79_07350 [Chthonomonadales bacterium]|nr:hypothetical protein [Chthonomonadales bacterium]
MLASLHFARARARPQIAARAVALAATATLLIGSVCLSTGRPDEASLVQFDFETGNLQGWRIVEGAFARPICDRDFFHNDPTTRYNKQGRYLLSTLSVAGNAPDDRQTGVIESPVFVLRGPTARLLVGGGRRDDTYVALCTLDGEEALKARGADTEAMQTVVWDVTRWVGKRVFLRMVDRNTGGWGHITLDDFVAEGALDEAATSAHFARRQQEPRERAGRAALARLADEMPKARAAVNDLRRTFGRRYRDGDAHAARLDAIAREAVSATPGAAEHLMERFERARRTALIANPLVSEQPIVFVVRPQYAPDHHNTETMFQVGEINAASFRFGSALKTIDFGRGGVVRTLVSAPRGIVRDPDVRWDARKIVFSMRRSPDDHFHLYEVSPDGSGLRALTSGTRLSDIDPAYLPDGDIVFSSTREPKVCQCNRHIQANLFRLHRAGRPIEQIGRNTLFEGHPTVLPDGRLLYYRWEYVDKHFGPAFGLWTANLDGTNHVLHYGHNSWTPGGMLDARAVPGTQWIVATFAACHDRPWGAIAVVDPGRGMEGTRPIVHCWPADTRRYLTNRRDYQDGLSQHTAAGQIDNLVALPVKYEDPFPLSARYYLCSRQVEGERMGLFLLDVFGNEVLLHVEGPGCYDPMPLAPRPIPPAIPSRIDLTAREGTFIIADVYQGYGMERVPRGTVRSVRVVEAPPKVHWSAEAWNIDATQAPAMNWNSTNNKRILGTAPVEPDGSAHFACPPDRFVYFQLLDANGMMVQSMRSGTMVRPGETATCSGCHANRGSAPSAHRVASALRRPASRLKAWYGPERDFNYLTEVQPVLDRHCLPCHDHGKPAGAALNLAGDVGLAFNASYVELRRRSPVRWIPDAPGAPKALVKAVDDGPPEVLPPYSWGSHRSRLVDTVRGEHNGVRLDAESLDRIVTWIDLNAPYYGSYSTAFPAHAFGRSPLTPPELRRLAELTGVGLGTVESEMRGSPVSFTRPELSPCLAGLGGPGDARWQEAVEIIRRGSRRLAERPREDMPGWRLSAADAARQALFDEHQAEQARARAAVAALRARQARRPAERPARRPPR